MKNKLAVVGAWGLFDHFMSMEQFPGDGETICLAPSSISAQKAFFGDCSGNIAVVAAKLGVRTSFISVAGEDFITSGYEQWMKELEIDTSGVTILPNVLSGHNYNCFAPDGQGFCISQQGAAALQHPDMIRREWFQDAAYTVICEAFSPYTLRAAQYAAALGSRVVISGMVGNQNPLWQDFLSLTNILFINRSEFAHLVSLAGSEEALFHQFPLERIFITMGSQGARILDPAGDSRVDIIRADTVLDPTGAGDAFVAGTLASLLRGHTANQAARIGAAASSFVIEAFGCQTNAPTWEQVQHRIQIQSN